MPVVGVNRDKLFEALGQTYTEEQFEELCFEYGIELDDATSEKEMMRKELAGSATADISGASEEIIYKIDIPANRYDMLCLEGIARALNVFRGREAPPQYRLADMGGKQLHRMVVKPETALVRPFVVCAVLRGVAFDATRYASFIDLQDKLHQNLCRQRTLVAIGTHDLATIRGPFTYEALPPEDISFVPLKQTAEFNARDLMQHYQANDMKLKKFVPIIQNSLVYPVIYDADRRVLSLPPIINGAHSAISLNTRDVFIECTATDPTKAKIVLNTVVAMFSQYCERPFEVEPVEVVDAFGQTHVYPQLDTRQMEVDAAYINGCIGLDLPADKMAALLSKMQLTAQASADGSRVSVHVPITRSDVLHACDVMEDVAIAYGFSNLVTSVPKTVTVGRELPLNQLCELLRGECAMAGFTEILTWALCSHAENFEQLRRLDDGATAACIGNPATAEFEVCRTSLLPGALKTLGANRDAPLPVRLFEVSDVILLSEAKGCGAANSRRLVAVHCDRAASFEVIHGLLNRVMEVLAVPYTGDSDPELERLKAGLGGGYEWRADDSPTFFPGRHASVHFRGQRVGEFGIIHPDVLAAFDIVNPVAALELDVEPFCFDQHFKQLTTQIL
ncbi:putative phenylalanine-tRNA ligase beta subunit [Micractinium conductrix]|uniref:phenylalanine--tRNA ligase n=1 Tax=Micractinium conductrix TaxID=554055 RepID=A0A2P6VGW8_9CHLO|nr:putative phenylalanine-tRNA ligase beta subunit [Micractinium conductrix]|eukprot:PSC73331.1 putative phenylalanine-tRNA ligase beta subunit [Micractinium conductrix]